jgi:hypothetical protein
MDAAAEASAGKRQVASRDWVTRRFDDFDRAADRIATPRVTVH